MSLKKWCNSRTAIIFGGILLTAYLVLILTVTNLGQTKLKETQNQSIELKILNYTDSLSFFFNVSRENLAGLASKSAAINYFANRAAGMSIEYGLGSSLFNFQQVIKKFSANNSISNTPIYQRILIIGLGGTKFIDTKEKLPFDISLLPLKKMEHKSSDVFVYKNKKGIQIALLQTIYLQNKPVAIVAAIINRQVLVQQLSNQENENSKSCLSLSTPAGSLFVWNTLCEKRHYHNDWSSSHNQSHRSLNHIYLDKIIKGTPFKLSGWFEPINDQDIFTSAWFIAGVSLLAVPVLFGLIFLMRVNNTNLILQTQIEVSAHQQKNLAKQNNLLQQEVKKREHSERKLAYQATHDSLTGLSNRNHGVNKLNEAIIHGHKSNEKVLVLFLDLDNFKQINDTIGHDAGDNLLIQASERLRKIVENHWTPVRFGGDEFLLVVPALPNKQGAYQIAKQILSLFEAPFKYNEQEFFISTSIGMSLYPKHGNSAASLLKKADIALYRVKDAGRNGFLFYTENMNQDIQRTLELNVRLHQAVRTNAIKVFYQPIVDLTTKKIIGAEALIRWMDPELGFISPDEFIPIAEKTGLIHRLGDYVLTTACQQASAWQSITPLKIAVNFSSVQFRYCEHLKKRITYVLQKTGLSPDKLDIEVTESLLIRKDKPIMEAMSYLRNLGTGLSIDDFGTGYSALSYLQKFDFSKLKIDRTFVSRMHTNPSDKTLIKAILAMAKSLKLAVIAEGIEDEKQAAFLLNHGCEYGQGYLFSKPLASEDFTQLLLAEQQKSNLTA